METTNCPDCQECKYLRKLVFNLSAQLAYSQTPVQAPATGGDSGPK